MFTSNKKKATVILFLVAFVTFGVAGYNPYKSTKQNQFKNLKILPKDISKDSLYDIMDGFKKALGVRCTFCHVHIGEDFKQGWDYASDSIPEKEIARYMLKMTAGINSTYFNSTYFNNSNSTGTDTVNVVTCNTCHRGIPHPDAEAIEEQKMKSGDTTHQGFPPPPPPKK